MHALLRLLAALAVASHAAAVGLPDVLSRARSLSDWIVAQRRLLHAIPEPGYEEHNTTSAIRVFLEEHGISYKSPYAKTGIVAWLGSGQPVVALRADMDALPVHEPEGLSFRSQNEGWMHACGHDGHMSMLMGAAKLLKEAEGQGLLPQGTIKFVFQPAEEGGAGGEILVDEGALDDVDAAFGFHVMPHIPTGVAATRAGTIMAGALSFRITLTGRGGHAALPHLNIDPIVAASSLITALQTLVSRETPPLGSAVFSVTLLRAGDGAYNVIPDDAMFGGTIRALTHEHLMFLKRRIEEMVPAVASGFSCSSTVDWRLEEQPYYPPTVNNDAMAAFAAETAAELLGSENSQGVEPIMAGEDFSFFCRKVPCAFVFLGIRNETAGSVHALHNPRFRLDEGVLHKGAALHAALAIKYLSQHAAAAGAAHPSGGETAAAAAGGGGGRDEL